MWGCENVLDSYFLTDPGLLYQVATERLSSLTPIIIEMIDMNPPKSIGALRPAE